MKYTCIDMETYLRKQHFEYFKTLAYSYTGMTVPVEITQFFQYIKARQLPFFLSICYCVSQAANRIPEFRQRIVQDQILEFDHCRTSHTVALQDGTYCYCDLDSHRSFEDYLIYAIEEQEKVKKAPSIQEEETLDKLFVSTISWVSYTALVNPTPFPPDSNPRITWGKVCKQDKKIFLPITVLCHHALVDGMHIAVFYEYIEEEMQKIISHY